MKTQKQSSHKAAIYIRLARQDDEGAALQRSLLLDFAREQGFENCREYCDNGFNGVNLDRPAFSSMNKAIDNGEINTVIMKSICRVSRNFLLIDKWLEDIHDNGVSFITHDGSHEPPQISLDVLKHMRSLIFRQRKRL